jgi:AcrR family transcriptional regulator
VTGGNDESQRAATRGERPAASAPSGFALTWGVRPIRRRGPAPSLTVEQIARTAIALADLGGLDDVTMASVAERVGCTKMALYRYVNTKEDLLHVMFDAALGQPAKITRRNWRAGIKEWAGALLERYLAHPWSVDVPLGALAMTYNRAQWLEASLAILRSSGLPTEDKLRLVLLLNGHALFTAKLHHDAKALAAVAPSFPEGRLADLPEVAAAASYLAGEPDSRSDFEWGLDRILDGVDRRR